MNYLRSVFGKKQIILAITAVASLIIFTILTLICVNKANKQTSQQFAKRWGDPKGYAQVSAFISELSGFEESSMEYVRLSMENHLETDSILAKNENARRCIVAYSGIGEAEISSGKNTLTVKAYGVGGDFFMFHPYKLLYGSFFDGYDIMDDHVVLDSNTAWSLFGSPNVVGKTVVIGTREHLISGVIERETGRLNDLAGNNTATIYMSLSSMKENAKSTYLSTVEALLPNPVENYAKGLLTEALNLEEERVSIIENTGRFRWTKLLVNAKNFGFRGMNNKGLVYPYWENVARGTEDILTPICVTAIIFLIYPIVLLIILLFRMWKKRTIHKKDVFNFLQRKLEEYREERKRRIEDGEYI